MKKTLIITGIIVVIAVIALIVISKLTSKKETANLYAQVEKGQFDIVVTTTGELQAENSTDIRGPEFTETRNIRFMDIKVQDIVPEGTEVKKGDYVATLDRTSFDNTLKDELDKLVTFENNLEVKVLDTAVTLSNLRDNIKNLKYTVEEAAITLQQSKYEPPTTIRQAEIALDKAQRSLDQTVKGYSLRVEQAKSEMRTIQKNLSDQRQKVSDLQRILSKFIISAPSDGMVIYKRDRLGAKRKVGSSISPWDNVVATLPDLSKMISKTYVNEIDVSKVKSGQKVDIIVDAFPERTYTGIVSSVANIGEQLPNADAKVFEVLIKVDGSDPILRPSMTSGNKIITKTINDVIFIPLECVQAGADSVPYVYTRNRTRQVVVLGESNENNVIIDQGLTPGTTIYLSTPTDAERFRLAGEELIPVIKEKEKARKAEELRIRQEAEKIAEERSKMSEFGQQGMDFPGRGGNNQYSMGSRQGGPRDTAAMRRRMQQFMKNGKLDTAAMRRSMQQFRNNQQGGTRDTSSRRGSSSQIIQQRNNQD
jgi:hypothetical protein